MLVKMNKFDFWNQIFASNKKLIVAVLEIVGGLITRESYLFLKRPGAETLRMKAFLARAVITLFCCLLINTYLYDISPKYHYALLGTFAICCLPVLEWFMSSFLPGLLKALKTAFIKFATGYVEKVNDKEEGDGSDE